MCDVVLEFSINKFLIVAYVSHSPSQLLSVTKLTPMSDYEIAGREKRTHCTMHDT